jgi:hypothetical protein
MGTTEARAAGAAKGVSIDINHIGDAYYYHLIATVNDLAPGAPNGDSLAEALRNDLHQAITQVIAQHRLRVLQP